jgi:hypothetical protein
VIQSGLVPNELKSAIEDLTKGGYPKNFGELAVNGNDLVSMNVEPRNRGTILSTILSSIYADKLPNDRETLLNFIRKQNG